MVLRVKKRPIEASAVKYDKANIEELKNFCGNKLIVEGGKHYIDSLEGKMECKDGCYVIKGVNGEFWPCDGDVFKKSYDVLESKGLEALTAEQRDALKDSDFALPSERRYPIQNADHVKAAWRMLSLGKNLSPSQRDTIKRNILKRAKQLKIDTSDWEKSSNESVADGMPTANQDASAMSVIDYILNQLSEESGELVQASCKAIRFGLYSVDPKNDISSIDKVSMELADILGVVEILNEELAEHGLPVIDPGSYLKASIDKRMESLKEAYELGHFTLLS